MEIMTIYHGSDHRIERPLYGMGREDNDFGPGFYATADSEKAQAWAVTRGGKEAFCSEYQIDTTGLRVMNLEDYELLAWIAETTAHRGSRTEFGETAARALERYRVSTADADILLGFRADDAYLDIIEAFLRNQFSVDEATRLFYELDFGEQIVIRSPKAFERLTFRQAAPVQDMGCLSAEEPVRNRTAELILQRQKAILFEGYHVEGLTMSEASANPYVYDRAIGTYRRKETADVPSDKC